MTTKNWLNLIKENKAFYMNVFQSVSQKEFQRIIREFFIESYKWQMEQRMKRELREEEFFVLRIYLFGAMEIIYEWIATGMSIPVDQLVDLQELAMPEHIKNRIITGENVPYQGALDKMEQYLLEQGLLQTIS